jgi:hypothetical protein
VIILPEIKELIDVNPLKTGLKKVFFVGFVLQNMASNTNKNTIFAPVTAHEGN